MHLFMDMNGVHVELTFGPNKHGIEARHVLVVCQHENKWLLTRHRERGIEFPGGKAENGETIEQAAIREVKEETGASICNVKQFAEYVVFTDQPFCKAVFTAEIIAIDEHPKLFETEGARWMTEEELQNCTELSFHMKDSGMDNIREWVLKHER